MFVVAEWDRATRSMMDGLNLMRQIHAKGATIKVLDRNSLLRPKTLGSKLVPLKIFCRPMESGIRPLRNYIETSAQLKITVKCTGFPAAERSLLPGTVRLGNIEPTAALVDPSNRRIGPG